VRGFDEDYHAFLYLGDHPDVLPASFLAALYCVTCRPRVVFILGTAYCGSTLLGQCLSNRPRALFVGEIFEVYKGWRAPRYGCEFILGKQCSFWERY